VTQISEAVQLAKDDLVRQLTDESWNVQSLSGENTYKVKVADSVHAYDLWCTCSAWRFKKGEKDCKHCEAVRQIDKGNNVPTKQTITKRAKRSKLKTQNKTNPYLKLAGQLSEIADFWDSKINPTQREQIINELNYDPSVFNSTNFNDLSQKLQYHIVKDYKNYLEDKELVSKTLAGIMDYNVRSLSNLKHNKQPSKKKLMKNVKVTCWHCGNADQKIISFDEAFMCDKCKELLWTGDGGFEEIKVGVWK